MQETNVSSTFDEIEAYTWSINFSECAVIRVGPSISWLKSFSSITFFQFVFVISVLQISILKSPIKYISLMSHSSICLENFSNHSVLAEGGR